MKIMMNNKMLTTCVKVEDSEGLKVGWDAARRRKSFNVLPPEIFAFFNLLFLFPWFGDFLSQIWCLWGIVCTCQLWKELWHDLKVSLPEERYHSNLTKLPLFPMGVPCQEHQEGKSSKEMWCLNQHAPGDFGECSCKKWSSKLFFFFSFRFGLGAGFKGL